MQYGDAEIRLCDFTESDCQHDKDQVGQQDGEMLEEGIADTTCHHGDGQCPVLKDADGR